MKKINWGAAMRIEINIIAQQRIDFQVDSRRLWISRFSPIKLCLPFGSAGTMLERSSTAVNFAKSAAEIFCRAHDGAKIVCTLVISTDCH
jgi:hypothetical protein